jgi:hypothetical protein
MPADYEAGVLGPLEELTTAPLHAAPRALGVRRLRLVSNCLGETGSVSVVKLFDLHGGQVIDGLVTPGGVEPLHPVQRVEFDGHYGPSMARSG